MKYRSLTEEIKLLELGLPPQKGVLYEIQKLKEEVKILERFPPKKMMDLLVEI